MKKLSIIMTIIAVSLIGTISIKADVKQDWTSSQSRYRYDDHGTNTYSSWETTPHTWEPTLPVNKIQWRVKATTGLSYENTYIIKFAYRPIPQAITPTKIQMYADTGTVEYEEITCGQWAYNDDGFNVVQCTFTPKNNISANTWLIIEVNFKEAYLTSIRSYMNKYEERTGTNAVITQTGDKITNEINNLEETIINNNQILIDTITEQNSVCEMIDKDRTKESGYLTNTGEIATSSSFKITDYIKIDKNSKLTLLETYTSFNTPQICFYNINKTLISCISISTIQQNSTIQIPTNSSYVRISINNNLNRPQLKLCRNGNQAILDSNHTYTSENIDNEVNQYENQQNQINNQINLNTEDGQLTILWLDSPMNYIWGLVTTYLNPIMAFIYSILALGIIRLILGR